MRGILITLLHIGSRSVGETRVPDQVLSAVPTTPVPVSAHHGVDEARIVLPRTTGIISGLEKVVAAAASWSSGNGDGQKGEERAGEFHFDMEFRLVKDRVGSRSQGEQVWIEQRT